MPHSWRHAPSPSACIQLSHVTMYALAYGGGGHCAMATSSDPERKCKNSIVQNLLPECAKMPIFRRNFAKFSRGHAPRPPENGRAFGTSPKVDLWRHTIVTKLGLPFGNFLRTPLHVCFAPLRHYRNSRLRFSFFTALFSWMTNKNLQRDHCSSICKALMMITGVIETFAICRLYRFFCPWFSLYGNFHITNRDGPNFLHFFTIFPYMLLLLLFNSYI